MKIHLKLKRNASTEAGCEQGISLSRKIPEDISESDLASILYNVKIKAWGLFALAVFFICASVYLLILSLAWQPVVAGVVIALYTVFLGYQKYYVLKIGRYIIVECLCTNYVAAGIKNRDARYSFLIIDNTDNVDAFDLRLSKRSKFNKNITYYICFQTDKLGNTSYTNGDLLASVRKTPEIKHKN